MKNFLLISKNWIKSLWKIKITFGLFLILCFISGAMLSTFIEINKQINNQNQLYRINDPQFEKQEIYQNINSRFNSEISYHLFCTDYFEVIKNIDGKKHIKRLPKFTFGKNDGCFKISEFIYDFDTQKQKKSYELKFKNSQINQVKKDFIAFDGVQISDLKFNKLSPYYQNSLHGRIIKKYQDTNNKKFLKWADTIENNFKPLLIKQLNKILKKELTQSEFFDNHLTLVPKYQKNNLNERLQQLKIFSNNSSIYNQKQYDLFSNLASEWEGDGVSTKFDQNRQNNKNLWKVWLEKSKKWILINKAKESSYLNENDFINNLLNKIQNWNDFNSNNKLLTLNQNKLIELKIKDHFEHFIKWVEQLDITNSNPSEAELININWLLANTSILMKYFETEIANDQIKAWTQADNLWELIKPKNDQLPVFINQIDHDWNNKTKKKTLKELLNIIENNELSNSFLPEIFIQLEQNKQSFENYQIIDWYYRNESDLEEIIAQLKTFIEKNINPEIKDNLIEQLAFDRTFEQKKIITDIKKVWSSNTVSHDEMTLDNLKKWSNLIEFKFKNLRYWINKFSERILKINSWHENFAKEATTEPVVKITYDADQIITEHEIIVENDIPTLGGEKFSIDEFDELKNIEKINQFILPKTDSPITNFFNINRFISLWESNNFNIVNDQGYLNNWKKFLNLGNLLLENYHEIYFDFLKTSKKIPTFWTATDESFYQSFNYFIDRKSNENPALMIAINDWWDAYKIAKQNNIAITDKNNFLLKKPSEEGHEIIQLMFLDSNDPQLEASVKGMKDATQEIYKQILDKKIKNNWFTDNPSEIIDHDGRFYTEKKTITNIKEEKTWDDNFILKETLTNLNFLYVKKNLEQQVDDSNNEINQWQNLINSWWQKNSSKLKFSENIFQWISKWKEEQSDPAKPKLTTIYETLSATFNDLIHRGLDISSIDTKSWNVIFEANNVWNETIEQVFNNHLIAKKDWIIQNEDFENIVDWIMEKDETILDNSNIPLNWLNLKTPQNSLISNNKNWFNYLDINFKSIISDQKIIKNIILNNQAFVKYKNNFKIIPKLVDPDESSTINTGEFHLSFINELTNESRIEIKTALRDYRLHTIETLIEELNIAEATEFKIEKSLDDVDDLKTIKIPGYKIVFTQDLTDDQKTLFQESYSNIFWNNQIKKKLESDDKWKGYGLKSIYDIDYNLQLKHDKKIIETKFFYIEFTDQTAIDETSAKDLTEILNQEIRKKLLAKINKFKEWNVQQSIVKVTQAFDTIFTITWHKIANELADIEVTPLIKTYIRENITSEKGIQNKYLIIRENLIPQYELIDGRRPLTDEEIVISPIVARNNPKYQIGKKFNLLEIKNNKITGIGIQREFIHPILHKLQKELPSKNQFLIYLNHNSYYLLKNSYLRHQRKSIFVDEDEEMFLKFKEDDSEEVKNKKKHQLTNYLGYGDSSFTEASIEINKKALEVTDQPIIWDNKFSPLNIIPIVQNDGLDYVGRMNGFVWLNGQWILWSLIFVIIIFLFIIGFASVYMIEKKINMNRAPIGVLKSLGIKNIQIWWASTPIMVFIFIANFFGWIVGVFLQLIIFSSLEKFLNFTFIKYSFDIGNLFISFGFNCLIILLTIIYFEKRKFSKMNALKLLNYYEGNENWLVKKIKNTILVRIPKLKNPLIKINYVFFVTLWKKIIFLFFVFAITAFSLMTGILVLTIKDETIHRNYDNIKYTWKFNYLPVISGNPMTRKNYWVNKGLQQILSEGIEENQNFLINSDFNFYKRAIDGNDAIAPEKFQEPINTNLSFIQPLYGKIFNYTKINQLFKGISEKSSEITEVLLCKNILERSSSPAIENQFKPDCLKKLIYENIPFNLPDKTQNTIFKNNFPLTLGVVDFQKNDEFFTEFKAKLHNKNENFKIIGLPANTEIFKINPELKKRVFFNQDQSSAQIDDVVEVIANKSFLIKNNLKVGQKIGKIYLNKKYFYYKNFVKPIQNDDWTYEDYHGKVVNYDDIPQDARFYNGDLINKDLKKQILNREIKLLYRGEIDPNYKWNGAVEAYEDGSYASQYREWIDVTRIKLKLPDESEVYPFRSDLETDKFWNNTKTSWFGEKIYNKSLTNRDVWEEGKVPLATNTLNLANNLENKKTLSFKIVGEVNEYREPKLFIPQKYANLLLDYPLQKSWNKQYSWFNGKYSFDTDNYSPIYNYGWGNEFGFINFDIMMLLKADARKSLKTNYYPVEMEKKIIVEYADYFVGISMILIVFTFLIICFMFIWLTKSSLHTIRNISLKLKLFGYSSKIILWQMIQNIILPFLISFSLGAFLAIFTLEKLSEYIINYDIFLFFSNDFSLYLIALLPILILLVLTIITSHRKIQKASLSQEINID